MSNWGGFFSRYALPLLRLKAIEFLVCALLGSALIFAVPGVYYREPGLLGAVRGGVIFAGMFFVLTLYPIISAAIILLLAALRVRSRLVLSLVSGLFLLAYTAWWATQMTGGLAISFWVAWLVMGVLTFLLALWLLPGGKWSKTYPHLVGQDKGAPCGARKGSGTGDRRYLVTDHQGSVIAENGSSTTRYAYGPYGEPDAWTGSRFRYTGQAMLPQVQLYHYKARVYDPVLGRFLQPNAQ